MKVLGFAGYAPFRPRTGYNRTMEHSVYLDGDARGRGLGRALHVAPQRGRNRRALSPAGPAGDNAPGRPKSRQTGPGMT